MPARARRLQNNLSGTTTDVQRDAEAVGDTEHQFKLRAPLHSVLFVHQSRQLPRLTVRESAASCTPGVKPHT
jgi:hypothetical protein